MNSWLVVRICRLVLLVVSRVILVSMFMLRFVCM